MAFAGPDPAAARRSHRLRIATLILGAGLLAWQSRAYVLTAIGSWLTVDEAPTPVAMMVVSLASVRADALEVARLYHDGSRCDCGCGADELSTTTCVASPMVPAQGFRRRGARKRARRSRRFRCWTAPSTA